MGTRKKKYIHMDQKDTLLKKQRKMLYLGIEINSLCTMKKVGKERKYIVYVNQNKTLYTGIKRIQLYSRTRKLCCKSEEKFSTQRPAEKQKNEKREWEKSISGWPKGVNNRTRMFRNYCAQVIWKLLYTDSYVNFFFKEKTGDNFKIILYKNHKD